jgi:hypothetical protein
MGKNKNTGANDQAKDKPVATENVKAAEVPAGKEAGKGKGKGGKAGK